jgi:hypothetical protein
MEKKKEKCFLLSIQFETKREGYGSLEQGAERNQSVGGGWNCFRGLKAKRRE